MARAYPATKSSENVFVKHWEIIANDLSKGGWSWGYTTHFAPDRPILHCVDAHRDDGRRFIVRSDKKLTAFLQLEEQTRAIPD